MIEQHTCEAVVVHCIDFRFQHVLNGYFDKQFPDGYDLVSVVGGVKELAEKGVESEFLLHQLQVSCDLHHPKNIVLIQHEDCGAYGGSRAFNDSKAEVVFQKEQLGQAENLLKREFPDCDIQKYFAHLTGELNPV